MNKTAILKLGPLDQIAVGHGLCFVINRKEIAVFRSRNGELYAIENRCPHRGGPLAEGISGDGKIVCPLHGHKFDLKTGQGSEERECVKTFKVWDKDGEMFIEYPLGSTPGKFANV
jgi:nitrite reductase (NADH) small subunit